MKKHYLPHLILGVLVLCSIGFIGMGLLPKEPVALKDTARVSTCSTYVPPPFDPFYHISRDIPWNISAATTNATSNGTMYRNDLSCTGVFGEGKTPPTGRLLWKYPHYFSTAGTERTYHETPIIANSVVYFWGLDNHLMALNASTGALIWNTTTVGYSHHSPAVADEIVHIGYVYNFEKNAAYVTALNASTGTELWDFDYGDSGISMRGTPIVANGVAYYCGGATGFGGGVITAIDAKNGAVLGELGSFSDLNGVSVIADGMLYTGSHGNLHRNKWYGTLYAVNISTGAEVWSFGNSPEFGSIYNAPAVSNGVVYFGSEDGNLYAVG